MVEKAADKAAAACAGADGRQVGKSVAACESAAGRQVGKSAAACAGAAGRQVGKSVAACAGADGRQAGKSVAACEGAAGRQAGKSVAACAGAARRAEPCYFLLDSYFRQGWLDKKYYGKSGYRRPYTADDRLLAGKLFYADFLRWQKGLFRCPEFARPRVDTTPVREVWIAGGEAERFRRVLNRVSRLCLPVLYKIVLEGRDIRPPTGLSTREKLYFNHEIRVRLCQGLDELVVYYVKRA